MPEVGKTGARYKPDVTRSYHSSPAPTGERNSAEGLLPKARPSTSSRARSISWVFGEDGAPAITAHAARAGAAKCCFHSENWVRFASLARGRWARRQFTHSGQPSSLYNYRLKDLATWSAVGRTTREYPLASGPQDLSEFAQRTLL